MLELTPAERRVYDALDTFQRKNGYTPSVRVLADQLDRHFTGVSRMINALVDKNAARRISDRSIELLPLR
jgi:DNA-binding MarR family transcriptional regulator